MVGKIKFMVVQAAKTGKKLDLVKGSYRASVGRAKIFARWERPFIVTIPQD
jgi:hypothetical protein